MADAQSELDLLKRVIKLQTENDDMITQARKEQAELKARIANWNRKCKEASIGFIILAGTRILKNSKILLIVIGKKDAYVKIMDFFFLRYDEKPEIVIPQRIQKIKEFINQVSKGQINVEINKAYYSICDNTTSTDQKHFVE
ncbi:hypothetical protein Glove_120g131 [Diversispora epigaea]|uniref:Uncharacterized protein n=1 Tax=Diversispora epigaea TaxID=1348612 RepID=A0A397IZD5_9GLOM|nr:hypothetical protein Glove_120g131 [Diversispora epigaea]